MRFVKIMALSNKYRLRQKNSCKIKRKCSIFGSNGNLDFPPTSLTLAHKEQNKLKEIEKKEMFKKLTENIITLRELKRKCDNVTNKSPKKKK